MDSYRSISYGGQCLVDNCHVTAHLITIVQLSPFVRATYLITILRITRQIRVYLIYQLSQSLEILCTKLDLKSSQVLDIFQPLAPWDRNDVVSLRLLNTIR